MDKNAEYIDCIGSLGFGFLELGTVTPKAQPGNPKPGFLEIIKTMRLSIDLVSIIKVLIMRLIK